MNYQKETEKIVERIQREGRVPKLLLHSCCAPCSSYVLEYLSQYFEITVFYYNPNIYPEQEYRKRVIEQEALIRSMNCRYPITFLEGNYEKDKFYEIAKGLEEEPEGGERCRRCYRLRLRAAALAAKEGGYDYVTTTLSISPMKKADWLNEIGQEEAEQQGVSYLLSDFKKKNGYQRSIQLSKQYGLYRQDYCGCVFSREERRKQQEERKKE